MMHGHSTINAAQFREAKERWAEAQLTNEVREFFMNPPNTEAGGTSSNDKPNFTDVDSVKPGVYGKVIVTRSVEKEREIHEAKKQTEGDK